MGLNVPPVTNIDGFELILCICVLSTGKLSVTTPSRHAPCRGHVQVETIIGGVGVSSVEFAFVEKEIAAAPEVSGVSPREGPQGGAQRVVLRGNNLGECKEDVVRVVIADVDCTESLEYFSPGQQIMSKRPHAQVPSFFA